MRQRIGDNGIQTIAQRWRVMLINHFQIKVTHSNCGNPCDTTLLLNEEPEQGFQNR